MKISKWVGIATYTILLIFAIIFYKERVIFMDASFLNFLIIKNNELAIQVFRFGAVITQLCILIPSKLGIPLKYIILIYSVSFILLYGGIYGFIKHKFGNDKLSLSLLLYNILIVSGTFYWVQSEQIQGSAILMLAFSFLFANPLKSKYPELNTTIFYLLLFTAAFTHPILLFQVLFFLAFLYISDVNQAGFPTRKEIVSTLVFFIGVFIIKMAFFGNYYDRGAISNVSNFIYYFPNYFKLPSFKKFFQYVLTDYYFLIILLVLMTVFYRERKDIKKLILLNCAFFAYLFLVNVSYKDGADKFYIESHYLSLSFFVIIPFVYDYLPGLAPRRVLVLLSIIIIARLVQIYSSHTPFTARLNWERNFLAKTANDPNKKIVMGRDLAPMDTLFMNWATPYEFWLLSTIEQKETRSVVILDDPNKLDWTLNVGNSFITQWGNFKYEEFPKKYFIFKDSGNYIKLNK